MELPTKKVVRREEIARMLREVIPGDESRKTNRVRERVKEMQQIALNAVSEGGSSYAALSHVAKTIKESVAWPLHPTRKRQHTEKPCQHQHLRVPPCSSSAALPSAATSPPASPSHSAARILAYPKLALLLDPTSPDKLPISDEALARVQKAWHVLSQPDRRALHDLHLHRTAAAAATFWTACPHCWNLFEYPKSNHGCALRCQVYAKSFRGESVMPPLKLGDAVVEGEQLRQYYSCEASVPVMCYEVQTEEAGQSVRISDITHPCQQLQLKDNVAFFFVVFGC
ncbi:hypothetical protein Fmac_021055 [Flemingia macrophylla]|uniref:J domain-containing protein n=1 Tax=Flemingia macrophylla TaxID=520843 RepID=A0ABD1LVQ8_9FABA